MHLETLAAIYCNSSVALNVKEKKIIDVSQVYEISAIMKVNNM